MNTLSNRKIIILFLVSLFLGIIFNYLFFQKQFGVSVVIYVSLLLSAFFLLFYYFKINLNRNIYWYAILLVFFSCMVTIRDNEFLLFWNLVIVLGILLVLIAHIIGRSIIRYEIVDYLRTGILLPLKIFLGFFSLLSRVFLINNKIEKNEKIAHIIKGVVITMPILLILILLLSSSDLVFNHLVSKFFFIQISEEIWFQAIIIVFVTSAWLGIFAYAFENAKISADPVTLTNESKRKFGLIEAGILLGTTSLLYLIFVIIQVKYLFAGHNAIASLGFTYAEYAHKGFAELILVSLITFAIIFLTERFVVCSSSIHAKIFQWLCLILTALIFVIMASAFLRLYIYEQAYSFTLLRILVQAFIIWIAAVFTWLLVKIFLSLKDSVFIFGSFVSILLFFAVFNLFNPDAYIARKNIEQFAAAEKLDLKYLSTLSADAVPQIVKLLEYKDVKDNQGNDLSESARLYLKELEIKLKDPSYQNWQSFNLARAKAINVINQKNF
ncbi:MAG: DUF4173 domain-containing protein [Candidatus Buchananbacteria bacterium]